MGHVRWVLKANDGVGSVGLAVVNTVMNMINENTSLMQLISIYFFTYNRSLHVSGKTLPIIRRT
jgi:hypothetical protein